jgi:large subunit ribosomal protein L31
MKDGIHPNYRDVCFVDLSNGFKFVTRSCAQAKEMIKLEDGREVPLFKLETTSESHPFYTGTQKAWTPWAAGSRSSATSLRTSRNKRPTGHRQRQLRLPFSLAQAFIRRPSCCIIAVCSNS